MFQIYQPIHSRQCDAEPIGKRGLADAIRPRGPIKFDFGRRQSGQRDLIHAHGLRSWRVFAGGHRAHYGRLDCIDGPRQRIVAIS